MFNHCKFFIHLTIILHFILMIGFVGGCNRYENSSSRNFVMKERLAESGDPTAQAWLADHYETGTEGVPRNASKALYWASRAAEGGNPSAQYNMAIRNEHGDGVDKNILVALKWYELCANNGKGHWQSEAQARLGLLYLSGTDVSKDNGLAFEWITKSALQGNAAAILSLANWHLGRETTEDQHIGRALLEASASQGFVEAQYSLALFLSKGLYMKHDAGGAFSWARKAALQGDAKSQYLLSSFLLDGYGNSIDETQGAEWCMKAAEQGNIEAQAMLAKLYAEGRGVPRDQKVALIWAQKWAMNGLKKAEDDYKNKRISKSEFQSIRKIAEEVKRQSR